MQECGSFSSLLSSITNDYLPAFQAQLPRPLEWEICNIDCKLDQLVETERVALKEKCQSILFFLLKEGKTCILILWEAYLGAKPVLGFPC